MVEPEADTPFSPEAVPVVCEGLDFEGLNITAEEGFLLSRLDGVTNVDIICSGSGLGQKKTLELISSLYEKKVIVLRDLDHSGDKSCTPSETPEPEGPQVFDLPSLKEILSKDLKKGKEIIPLTEAIFVNLENLSYYDLLGLTPNARKGKIKKAYFFRTKLFHPDRFFRQVDREFKHKLQEIFKQLNKGYRVLSDSEEKGEYDESLGIEKGLEDVEEVVAESSGPQPVKEEATPWKRIRVSRQKPVEERVRSAKKNKKKKAKPVPEGKKLKLGLKDEKVRMSSLLRNIEKMETKGGKEVKDQAARFYDGAMVEKERGNFKAAKVNLQLAVQYDSLNRRFKQALAELEQDEEGQKAELEFKAGLDAEKDGDLKSAARHFRESLQLGYESSKLYHRLAELMMELDSNYEKARALCLKAIEMESDMPEYHMTLARSYKGLGQKGAAMIQLQKVLNLDPKNKVAAKELKALKRG